MRIEIDIEKRHFFALLIAILVLGIVVFVGAYNNPPQWSSFQPSKMGHSVDEIDWSQGIDKTVRLVKTGTEINPTLSLISNKPIIKMYDSDGGSLAFYIDTNDGEFSIRRHGQPSSDFVISEGKVGIGKVPVPDTTSPAKLDVNGGIRFGEGEGITLLYKKSGSSCSALFGSYGGDYIPLLKKCPDGWHIGSDSSPGCYTYTEIICTKS